MVAAKDYFMMFSSGLQYLSSNISAARIYFYLKWGMTLLLIGFLHLNCEKIKADDIKHFMAFLLFRFNALNFKNQDVSCLKSKTLRIRIRF